jgi:hypothetical protein
MSDQDLEGKWLKAADYNNMKLGESVLLLYLGNEEYVLSHDKFMDVASAKSGVIVTKNVTGPKYALVAKASLINIHSNKTGLEAVDFDILSAEAKLEVSRTYAGYGADLVLAGGHASIFDLKLGLGVSSGIGIKDDSLTVKIAGTGLKLGRQIGVSVLGSEFGIDFGRLFG